MPYRWRPTVGGRRCLAMSRPPFGLGKPSRPAAYGSRVADLCGAPGRSSACRLSRRRRTVCGGCRSGSPAASASGKSTVARPVRRARRAGDRRRRAGPRGGRAGHRGAGGGGRRVRPGRCSTAPAGWTARRWPGWCSATRPPVGRLNAIVHPRIRARAAELIAAAPAGTSSCRTCRCWSRPARPGAYDLVVVVEAPERAAGAAAGSGPRHAGGGGPVPDGRAGHRRAAPCRRRRRPGQRRRPRTTCAPRSTPSGLTASPDRRTNRPGRSRGPSGRFGGGRPGSGGRRRAGRRSPARGGRPPRPRPASRARPGRPGGRRRGSSWRHRPGAPTAGRAG